MPSAQFRADPGYGITPRIEAVQGVDRSAAARGLLTSGATIKAIQDRAAKPRGSGLFGNYFNRLAGVAGTGTDRNGGHGLCRCSTAANG
jgi:hypothetical protein